MHLAPRRDLEVRREDPGFVRVHRGLELVQRPREVVAVVVEADVRVLAREVSAALPGREDLIGPGENPFGGLAGERVAPELPWGHGVRPEARVCVPHLLEVPDDPTLIPRGPM